MSYIRFVVNKIDPDSGRRQGIFLTGGYLRSEDAFNFDEEKEHDELLKWFDKNLARPESFSKSKRSNPTKVAISWFKPTAVEHLKKMHQFKTLLENHGITVEILKTDRPGYVVYEDSFQITAEPFADTPK